MGMLSVLKCSINSAGPPSNSMSPPLPRPGWAPHQGAPRTEQGGGRKGEEPPQPQHQGADHGPCQGEVRGDRSGVVTRPSVEAGRQGLVVAFSLLGERQGASCIFANIPSLTSTYCIASRYRSLQYFMYVRTDLNFVVKEEESKICFTHHLIKYDLHTHIKT